MPQMLRLLFIFLLVVPLAAVAQTELPREGKTGSVVISGKQHVKKRCKRKIMKEVVVWSNKNVESVSMVFSTIKEGKDSLWLRGVTEVPSMKNLHPISFQLIISVSKKTVHYSATNFKFEDINLTLDEWLDKYGDSENERHQKNVEYISKGVESHIFLAMSDLSEKVNR